MPRVNPPPDISSSIRIAPGCVHLLARHTIPTDVDRCKNGLMTNPRIHAPNMEISQDITVVSSPFFVDDDVAYNLTILTFDHGA